MTLSTLPFLILILFVATPAYAEAWHGIVPGRSTRQDVVRELGECPESKQQCEYNLATEDVFITFSGPKTCPSSVGGQVLLIERELAEEPSLTSLNLQQNRFKKFDPSWPRGLGYQAFIDEERGLAVKTFSARVFQISYFPTVKERQFCPTYYRRPKEFLDAIVEHAPIVRIDCPEDPVVAGGFLIFKADYLRGLSILLNWNVTAGKIVEGQGRRRMMLNTSGLSGVTITVSVERYDSTHRVSMASCKVQFRE